MGVLKIHSEPNYKYIFKFNLQYLKKITCITQQIFFASDETIATCDMLNPYMQETNLQTIFIIKKELSTNNGKKRIIPNK